MEINRKLERREKEKRRNNVVIRGIETKKKEKRKGGREGIKVHRSKG